MIGNARDAEILGLHHLDGRDQQVQPVPRHGGEYGQTRAHGCKSASIPWPLLCVARPSTPAKRECAYGCVREQIMGRSTMIWNQRQGDGRYRLDIGFQRPEHYAEMAGVDLADPAAVKQHLLADELYGGHASSLKDLIRAIDTPFHAWPLTYMPPDCFGWDAAPDVTLVGDAAHVTTPFIGEGVNIALQDSVLLTRALREHGMTKRAVQAYEKDMFARAKDVITKSVAAGRVYYDCGYFALFACWTLGLLRK